MTKQLSNKTSTEVEATENEHHGRPVADPDVLPDGRARARHLGMVSSGSARGFPIAADLRRADGQTLPDDTVLAFQYEAPGMDQPQVVTFKLDHIRPFNALSLNEQQDEEYIDRTKVQLKNTDQALAEGRCPSSPSGTSTTCTFPSCRWTRSMVAVGFLINRNAVRVV
ncbi:MAG: hypothetical protein U5K70_04380 [Halodesulfurarchaeum sp.]|nr:hypothetical protein [Halodesulfurarchaeum sp.]